MRVVVLLSTFNGQAYLRPQVDSILAQSQNNLHLVVRDDGSQDATVQILEEYAYDPRVTIIKSKNVGLPEAFFELFALCPSDADVVFLADQDDIWHPEKVSRAISKLSILPGNQPALYCSRLRLVSSDLKTLGLSPLRRVPAHFGNAIAENICTGCTAAFNRPLLQLLQRRPRDITAVAHHDWWMYLVASAFGTVIFDPVPHIDYRQHDANVLGMPTTHWAGLQRRLKSLFRNESLVVIARQVDALLECYASDLPAHARERANLLMSVRDGALHQRVRLLRDFDIHRQSRTDNLVWKGLVGLSVVRGVLSRITRTVRD